MNHLDEAKLLSALLGVLKKENSKVRKDILEELRTELQKGIEDQSGVKYLRLDEVEDFKVPYLYKYSKVIRASKVLEV
jgi:hypothetical protein